jgi:uncharacterized protein
MKNDELLNTLKEYKKTVENKYGIISLGVFGSVARNESGPLSDVDICVEIKNPDPFSMVHIKSEIEEMIKMQVDIVRVREKMNPHLKKRIEKDAVYV